MILTEMENEHNLIYLSSVVKKAGLENPTCNISSKEFLQLTHIPTLNCGNDIVFHAVFYSPCAVLVTY